MLWETISEETCDVMMMECSSFQMPRNSFGVRTGGGLRCLNATSTLSPSPSMHENMAVDDLSFYEDDALAQQRPSATSPPLMGLLSPEGSPKRFQIVERQSIGTSAVAAGAVHQKIRKSSALHRQKSIQSSTLSSNGTPAKSLHSVSSGSGDSTSLDDDEYMELFEMESLESQSHSHLNFPSDLNSLIRGHIKHSSPPVYSHGKRSSRKQAANGLKTPEMRRPSVRRCLSMTENQQPTPKTPESLPMKQVKESTTGTPLSATNSYCFKRPEPPGSASNSPILSKRYRSNEAEKENLDGSFTSKLEDTVSITPAAAPTTNTAPAARHILRKSMSMNDAEILSALARSDSRDQPDLIGDFSKPFVLPLMEGRHCDLKSVSSDTVAQLINGEFKDQVASYKIIDCRYPYEFEGGHIRGAKNLYTQEQIIEEFLTMQKTEQQKPSSDDGAGQKRNIIIFHCEFSSERGPKLSRFLRNHDRARNTNLYPALDYPEIYLLHNGYKEFYETHSELCEPVAYRPMLEPAFSEAYRHFRAKSKSWNGDGLGGGTARMKKSRSRLLL